MGDLNADTYYRIELSAHNSIGYSTPANLYVKTARGESSRSFGTLLYQAGTYGSVVSSATRTMPLNHFAVVPKSVSLFISLCCSLSFYVFVRRF